MPYQLTNQSQFGVMLVYQNETTSPLIPVNGNLQLGGPMPIIKISSLIQDVTCLYQLLDGDWPFAIEPTAQINLILDSGQNAVPPFQIYQQGNVTPAAKYYQIG